MSMRVISRSTCTNLQELKQEAEKSGLTRNQNKTKYMRHSRTQINGKDMELEIEGMKIEEVSKDQIPWNNSN
jgi:hypothetical protein